MDKPIRRIDDLGRVVIPKEVRKQAGIKEGDQLKITPTKKGILLTLYTKPKVGEK
jgi:AbrB family looped-hinge helix DNA binding protein